MLCCYSDNEKRLTKKVKELNGEIVGNAAKVQTALRLSEEDQTTIVTLKKEVEKAWKLVDASHEKVAANMRLPFHEKFVGPIMHSSDGAINASILMSHTMAMCPSRLQPRPMCCCTCFRTATVKPTSDSPHHQNTVSHLCGEQ